jgi:hypothetical protein
VDLAFALFFFPAWFSPFLLGFWQKRGAERGFLMVKLWWIAGEIVVGRRSNSGL